MCPSEARMWIVLLISASTFHSPTCILNWNCHRTFLLQMDGNFTLTLNLIVSSFACVHEVKLKCPIQLFIFPAPHIAVKIISGLFRSYGFIPATYPASLQYMVLSRRQLDLSTILYSSKVWNVGQKEFSLFALYKGSPPPHCPDRPDPSANPSKKETESMINYKLD